MKNTILILSIFSFLFVSCEKEIEIDLNDADQKIVIVGTVTNTNEPAQVRITKSVPFDELNVFPAVTNGQVEITRISGSEISIFSLVEVEPGVYHSTEPIGQQGATFKLRIVAEGEVYESQSTMPNEVEVVDFYFEEFLPGSLNPAVDFVDVGGIANFYKANLFINGELKPDIFITDDVFTDGQVNNALFGGPDLEFNAGDLVVIQIDQIDQANYNYWFTMSQNVNESTAAPANPESNISNGALGYFSAFSRTSVSGIVPE
jgi:hypothetical protein